MTNLNDRPDRNSRDPVSGPGDAQLLLTRSAIFFERAWPTILPALGIIVVLTIFSLVEVWRVIPVWLHVLTLLLAVGVSGVMLWRDTRGVDFPTRREAQQRLETDGAASHAPLQSLDDRPFVIGTPSDVLWRAHMQASAERAAQARFKGLRNTATIVDPYGMRFLLLGVLAIAFIGAGSDWPKKLSAGLAPFNREAAPIYADLWLEPPTYTGKAPIFLIRSGELVSAMNAPLVLPQNTKAIAQVNRKRRLSFRFETADKKKRADWQDDQANARAEHIVDDSGVLSMRIGRQRFDWSIAMTPDKRPLVSFTRTPETDDRNRVSFDYVTGDDYGVTETYLSYRLDPAQERPLDAPPLDTDALQKERRAPITGLSAADGTRTASLELFEDPWAGLQVLAKVIVVDGAAQTGETDEFPLELPTREFFNPLAKAVIEQRQTLATAEEPWRRAARSFDALAIAPNRFFDDTADYLLMRNAFWQVFDQRESSPDDVVTALWPLALQLEDKAVQIAKERLLAAQEALRRAIEEGASEEEISRLTEALRQAMNDYLQALAQSGQAQSGGAQASNQIGQSDLDDMLNSIRDLANTGAGNAARQMLSDLENILQNLRLGGAGTGSGGSSAGGSAGGGQGQGGGQANGPGAGQGGTAGEAGEIIGRQRELADDAFQKGQAGEGGGSDLAEQEGALGEALEELLDQLNGDENADPNGDAARELARARSEMRAAENALRSESFGAATSAMERAIASMRRGAAELARNDPNGEPGQGRGEGAYDPLGRPAGRAFGEGPETLTGESDEVRTRAVIDELRRRLSEPGRDPEEIEYLERLLERF